LVKILHELLTRIKVNICKVGMSPSSFIDLLRTSKRLKPSSAAYRRLKANREESLTKYDGSIYAYAKKAYCKESKKIGRVMMRKMATSRKSKT